MVDSQRVLDCRAFWGLWLLIAAAGPLASSGSAAPPSPEREDSRPGWVARRSDKPEQVWTEWRNSLAPRGGQVMLDLTTDSQTDYTIVIPAKPTAITRRAAEELQYWLRRVTGADFVIQPDSSPLQPREISVGQTNRLAGVSPHALATAGLEAVDRLPAEGYAVIVDGELRPWLSGRVFLQGPRRLSVLHRSADDPDGGTPC